LGEWPTLRSLVVAFEKANNSNNCNYQGRCP
jgi:hypothetical protein